MHIRPFIKGVSQKKHIRSQKKIQDSKGAISLLFPSYVAYE